MSFKSGDFVQCAEVIQFLDYDKIYTVEIGGDDGDLIRLVGQPGWHRTDRFKLAKKPEQTIDYTMSIQGPLRGGNIVFNEIESKASKNDSDKIDLSLIPSVALKEEAKAFMVGEKKYGRYNYTKGHKASQLIAAAMRHLSAWNEGEECDPIDGQHHLGSVRACCAMLLRQIELETLTDDRFKGDK